MKNKGKKQAEKVDNSNEKLLLSDVSGSLLYDKLAVIIQTKDGKIFQVALDKEMSDALFTELKMFFNGGVVKILPTELHGITLE